MGYTDWTEITILNTSDEPLQFRAARHSWGQFYSCEHFSHLRIEIAPKELNLKTIPARSSATEAGRYTIGASGRDNWCFGCQGSFEIFSPASGNTVATIAYRSPIWPWTAKFKVTSKQQTWTATQTGAYVGRDAALGNVTVTIGHTGST